MGAEVLLNFGSLRKSDCCRHGALIPFVWEENCSMVVDTVKEQLYHLTITLLFSFSIDFLDQNCILTIALISKGESECQNLDQHSYQG